MSTARPSPRSRLKKWFADSTVFQWRNESLRADLIFALPVAVCLAVGVAIGHPAVGLIAAGGAMNTGFGHKQCIDRSRLLPMIFVTLGMAFSGFVGVLIGHENLLLVFIAALWGFGYGMLTARPGGYGWVGQQCVITFLVASAFPAPLQDAAARGLLLLAGGILQLFLSAALLQVFGDLKRRVSQLEHYLREEQRALRSAVAETAESFWQRRFVNSAIPYSLRLAIVVGIGTEVYRRLHYPSGYWIPMTALLVLKPAVTDTVSRAVARALGTVAGAVLVSLALAHVQATPAILAAFTALFAWLSYGVLNVNYALFSTCITGYIVFLLSLNEMPGPEIAQRRAFCTLMGAAISLTVRLAIISRYRHWWRRALAIHRVLLAPRLPAD
ncbi:MAG TPA: FUSC family protein [Terracidiphilus sp.]|nr:FUSC family protein [Terracidiphilus sp.]